jgi:hypothetical protein
MVVMIAKRVRIPFPLLLFLLPIVTAFCLYAGLNLSCRQSAGTESRALKLLYTSDVGGALDPCG